jgi:hypothetical protein
MKKSDKNQEYNDLFVQNTKIGAEQLKWEWVKLNEKVIEVANEFDIDPTTPIMRAFLTSLILKITEK